MTAADGEGREWGGGGDGLVVRLARPGDNAALCRLAARVPMAGRPRIVTHRAPDFFALPALSGGRFDTYVAEDRDGTLVGCGTHVIRTAWVGGEPVPVGHVGDLRIEPAHRGKSLVRRMAEAGLARAADLDGVAVSTMAALRNNRTALRSARRGQGTVATRHVADYDMVSLPHRRVAMPQCVRPAGEADFDALAAFLEEGQRRRLFGWRLDAAALRWRLAHWPGLRLEDFLLVERDGRLVAAAAPWEPSPVRRSAVEAWGLLAPYRAVQAVAARLRGARPLPAAGADFRIAYLTHLEVAQGDADALRRLAVAALARAQGHAVAVLDEARGAAFLGLGARRLPVRLLAVSPDGRFPAFPLSPLGVEMSLA